MVIRVPLILSIVHIIEKKMQALTKKSKNLFINTRSIKSVSFCCLRSQQLRSRRSIPIKRESMQKFIPSRFHRGSVLSNSSLSAVVQIVTSMMPMDRNFLGSNLGPDKKSVSTEINSWPILWGVFRVIFLYLQ